jgi:nucleoside-diphosphate-sugar epimerase
LLQDLAAPYREFAPGIGGVPYPACDIVIHLAAHAKVYELVEQPHKALENVTTTFNVLEFCRARQVPMVFSSSREVYGDIRRYITEEQEADFSYTESPYSASKIAGEALIYSYARCYGLRYLAFRFSNVYGRFDNDIERMERVIPLFIRRITHGEPVTVYGREKVLDFTYVDDCVSGIVLGMERLLAGEVYNRTINLAYGEGNSLVRMAELIGEALEVRPEIIVEPSKRAGEVSYYVANIALARELLGYEPQVPLDEGIRRAVRWAQSRGRSG